MLQQRVKAANSAEQMKALAVECSNADSFFQQIEKLHLLYEEYVKICKDTIPLAEKNVNELNSELDIKSQSLDDVILKSGNLVAFKSHLCCSIHLSFLPLALCQDIPFVQSVSETD